MGVGYAPIYMILKDGVDITDHFNDRTTSIQVELNSGGGEGADRFRITVDDRDFAVARPRVGQTLQIMLGYVVDNGDWQNKSTKMADMGLYEINEVTFNGMPKSIMLTGTSVGMTNALKSQELKFHDNMTIGDILGQLAQKGRVGLKIDPELAQKKLTKNQQGISGFHLMQELERDYGAMAKFANGNLIFAKRDEGVDTEGNSMSIVVLCPWHFGTWAVKHTQRADFDEVKAGWWDKDKHETVWESEKTNTPTDEPTPFRMNKRFNSKEEAQDAIKAKKKLLKRATGEATVSLALGDPWVREQMPLVITQMRDGVDGSYIIDRVTHGYEKTTGITTSIFARPPGGEEADFADQLSGDSNTYSPMSGAPELNKNGEDMTR